MLPIFCYVVTLIKTNNDNHYQVDLKFSGAKPASFPSNHIIQVDYFATSSKLDSWIQPSWGQHNQVKNGKTSLRYFSVGSGNQSRMITSFLTAGLFCKTLLEKHSNCCPSCPLCPCSRRLGNSRKQVMGRMRQSDLRGPSGFPSSSK